MEKILFIYFVLIPCVLSFTSTLSGFGTNSKEFQQNSKEFQQNLTLFEENFPFYPQNGKRDRNSKITNGKPYMGPTNSLNLNFQVRNVPIPTYFRLF